MDEHRLHEFISSKDIQAKVAELGKQITADYQGKDLHVIGILKGSVVFMADLIRAISLPLEISFMSVSSYASGVATSGSVRLLYDIDRPLRGKDVLIVEDIIDSGYTLAFLLETLGVRQPASLKVCSLLDKPSRRLASVEIDYKGFEIEDVFAVGYGMDYAGQYRNLDYVARVEFIK
ncbi:MAG: hypoxanthine phosphoribosyltransferase [Deferribacteraceae bacterium]|jgi:hypoxanthine phosphoribosyltransferase|nr:hypoxanthine phosphoribosyltransferase [Deferribacteraceae bacterium]